MKHYYFLSLVFILLAGCGAEDEFTISNSPVDADITMLAPLSGLGDNGYNDESFDGLMEIVGKSGIDVSVIRPKTMEEAAMRASEWSEKNSDRRRLLMLPDAEYASLISYVSASALKSVLLFENDGRNIPDGIATFRISRYGASYLSGCLAEGSDSVHIVFGKKGDKQCEEAAAGFTDGYLRFRPDGKIIRHSLSDTYAGWKMPDSLYRLAASFQDDFFFTLAKGSNAGIYKFSRESPFVLMLIAGMDVDCAAFSKRVPFSMTVDVKTVVRDYVSRWIVGENISGHRDFGMRDGLTSVKLSTLFYEINDIWEDYYREPEYWSEIYRANYDEAIRKEAEYEEKR